jgi:PAS domain S-box-containing protein
MSRKLTVIALIVVGLHFYEVLFFGTSATGSLLANSLQIFASTFAATMCFGAFRRARGLARPFWILVGLSLATWGIANLGWMYYENYLGIQPPTPSLVRFLFNAQGMFFVVALLLDQERDSPRLDFEAYLDFLQILVVFTFLYVTIYFVPTRHMDSRNGLVVETWIVLGENFLVAILAGIQTLRARRQDFRTLYRQLAIYLAIYAVGSAIAEISQSIFDIPTGTFYDLAWTIPLLSCGVWAGNWKQASTELKVYRRKSIRGRIITNALLALAPLLALFQFVRMGREWQVLGSILLGISILCYAVRLGVIEFLQQRGTEIVRRQTLAMDSTTDGMAILNKQGEYIYVNAAFTAMMGYALAEEMVGTQWRRVFDPEDVQRIEGEIQSAISQSGRWAGQMLVHRSSGGVFPMEIAITGLPDGGWVTVSRDITERHQAEKARVDAEAKYRMLIEQVAAISYIAELGVAGQWFYVSPQVEKILGFTPDEWLANSKKWMDHVLPEDCPRVQAAEEASGNGEPYQAEYRMVRKDGRVIWVSDTAVTVHGSGSHPLMEGLIVDITERKQLESQLQQSSKMEAVGRLAGGIAHDFNNLLTIIRGYTELALNRAASQPELRSDIERIENASERAAALVRQLLAFSRRQVLQPKTIDLNVIVLNLDKLLRRLMDEHIEMITRVDQNVGAVKADPTQIEQVIMNLVVNARDAMPKGGCLTLETKNVELDAAYARDHSPVRPGSYVMLAVSDTGTGMDADTVAHIFEPFYTTKEHARGTGLGLSTVYGIVKQSGGYIWVHSQPGQGSEFKVYLPRVAEPASEEVVGKRSSAKRGGTETILLVEDEQAVRELTQTVLTSQGYRVMVAADAADAERICEKHRGEIQLLLTDVVMPGVSGRELAQRISLRRPGIRVLFMSGYTDNIIAQGGLLEEGMAFLQKPFTPTGLIHKIRDVLNQTPAR